MSGIQLVGVAKWFGSTCVLRDVDLVVPDGSITAVLGDSGSGKTTLLRLVAGFENVDAGRVFVGGRLVDDGTRPVRPQRRGVGYVPQEGALFPHLTVRANIGFGLHRAERHRVDELIELVGLEGLARRYPHQLSGGQQQRVALARALAISPGVVLLDEPFSSLDTSLRTGLRRDVARILAETGTTAVLVTHDQDEALALADQVAVLRDGRVAVCADPHDLYLDPPDLPAATSIGDANVLAADVDGDLARCVLGAVRLEPAGAPVNGPSRLLLRPEQLHLRSRPGPGAVAAVVVDAQFHGHDTLVDVLVEHPERQQLLARVRGDLVLEPGQAVWVQVRGTGRAWPVTGDEDEDHAIVAGNGRLTRDGGEEIDLGFGRRRGGARDTPGRPGGRRRRVIGVTVAAAGALLIALSLVFGLRAQASSSSAVGPVVFHGRIETTGRVRLSDPYTDSTTAKRVGSCAQAAAHGDDPTVAPRTWYVPTPPFSNTAEIEVGTVATGYHGPGRYSQADLQVGSGVLGIGQEDYNLASQYARASMTVDADGSGTVTFVHAPGDDDAPGPGWHGGITGSITWTCTS